MQAPESSYVPLADYGVIGDCRTIALVSRQASIDWWCEPRFDAPSLFGRLLDAERGGSFHLEAPDLRATSRRYRPATAVLETHLACEGGELVVTDFAAVVGQRDGDEVPTPFARQKLVRMVRCTAGSALLTIVCRPRPFYGRVRPRLTLGGPPGARRRILALTAGNTRRAQRHALHLSATRPWGAVHDATARLQVTLREGEELGVVIDYGPGDLAGEGIGGHPLNHTSAPPEPSLLHEWLDETTAFWRTWSSASTYRGEHREAVERSAITLKLLTYHPSGAIVAAGTTSLPEQIGGERNWDYRYTWLRDASFTLYALTSIGYRSEAAAFMSWLVRACRSDDDPLVLYRVDTAHVDRERHLDHLAGYRGSRPVRVGNGAAWQRQLDIYGGVLDAAYLAVRSGDEMTDDEWQLFATFADLAAARWRRPDASIWEVRGGHRQFTYSKVLCWVALDRACRLVDLTGRSDVEADRVARWRAEAAAIRSAIRDHGVREDGAFAQSYDSELLDASALLFPLVGYADVDGPAMRATLRAIGDELADGDLVRRYEPDPEVEGISGMEGHFLLLSFWLCDNLALGGHRDEARRRFVRLLDYANDLGIFTEQWDADTEIALGNLPQALTHLAVIGTAHNLEKMERGPADDGVRGDTPRDED